MTLWCFVAADTPEALEAALDYFEQVGFHYDNGTTPFPSSTHLSEARTIMHDLMYTVSILGGYSLVIWCQYRMLKFLRYGSDKMTERTRKSHAEVNRALIVLSVTPLVGIIGPSALMVALLVLQLQLGPVAVYITLSMTTITVVNPLTIVYFLRPFRKAVSDAIFSKSKTAVLVRTVATRSLEMDTVTA
ncbi:hypothetical protein AAVH_24527 [Aphelenchoides avenae]|nr:hypothetical protein AAVH_24527 [Aphelenchus avenae]